ncbi:MAG: PfkB family carbohydrate kinase, partial [Candidatus Dormiibacterota bacterium]
MPRIAVVGSLNVDLVAYVDHLPRPGETMASRATRRQLGGKGFNQAVALRQLGADVLLVGAVGDDEDGRAFEAELDRRGIDRTGVVRRDAATGMALITVDESGENTIVLSPGANLALEPDAINLADDAGAVLAQGELRAETTAAALAAAHGRRVLNAAPASPALLPAIAHVDLLIVNEGEAADLGGVDAIRAGGAHEVVVTLGSRGA